MVIQFLNIGIVDDEQSKINLIDRALKSGINGSEDRYKKYVLKSIPIALLSNDMDNIFHQIQTENIECLIVDYNLSSNNSFVNFTGVDLAQQLEKKFHDFPVFILTGYESKLYKDETYSVYNVYNYYDYLEKNSPYQESINKKIIEQVLNYREVRNNWEDELLSLLPKAGISAEIDSRIIELDNYIEKSIDGTSAISEKMKNDFSTNKFEKLIEKINNLIEEDLDA